MFIFNFCGITSTPRQTPQNWIVTMATTSSQIVLWQRCQDQPPYTYTMTRNKMYFNTLNKGYTWAARTVVSWFMELCTQSLRGDALHSLLCIMHNVFQCVCVCLFAFLVYGFCVYFPQNVFGVQSFSSVTHILYEHTPHIQRKCHSHKHLFTSCTTHT